MTNVVDLLCRRQDRGETVLHFASAADALAYATTQVRELERLSQTSLLLTAEELDLPLAQVRAVLAECTRLHALIPHHREEA